MKKSLFLLLSLFLTSASFAAGLGKPLPNWIDHSREKSDGMPPSISRSGNTDSVPSDFRIPAEYEPVSAVVVSWAGFTGMVTQIAQSAATKGKAQVWAASGPASISGVPSSMYSQIAAPVDTVWVRDYGPFGISAGKTKPGIVDTIYRHYQYRRNDDAFPSNLGKIKNIPAFPASFILDGGNFMVNSRGDLFMTKRTYLWNSSMSEDQVNNLLKADFKVRNIYTFEYAGYPNDPQDGTGHMDMFMKLLNDHTVLIAVADEEPYKSNGQKAVDYFKGKTAADGQPYKVITVKGWNDNGTWYTYTNSLIVNNVVLMPSYSGHNQDNIKAQQAYEEGMPGVTVVQINSDESITSGGSIHCTTQTIPKYQASKNGNKGNMVEIGKQVEDASFGSDEFVQNLVNFSF